MRGALREEAGFTLIEAVVSTVMMLAVLFALYAFFDAGARVAGSARDGSEAAADARLALQRLERELKGASSYDPSDPERDHLFFAYASPSEPAMPAARSVAFGLDRDGRCGLRTAAGGGCSELADKEELVRFYVNDSGTLIRQSNGQRVPLADGVRDLGFTYLDAAGNPAASEAEVRRVEVSLTVEVGGERRALSTSVAPRARAG